MWWMRALVVDEGFVGARRLAALLPFVLAGSCRLTLFSSSPVLPRRCFPPPQDEQELFDRAAQHAYESFRNKAAESRGMPIEAMQEVAQVGPR